MSDLLRCLVAQVTCFGKNGFSKFKEKRTSNRKIKDNDLSFSVGQENICLSQQNQALKFQLLLFWVIK
jgi:hypothetical protein